VIPFKQNPQGPAPPPRKRTRIYAVPAKAEFEIKFPRVEGYTQAIKNRVVIDWNSAPSLTIDPNQIPPEVQVKAALATNAGRPSLVGPGSLESVDLNPFRSGRREQQLAFTLARDLTKAYVESPSCQVPAHALFPQIVGIVQKFLRDVVQPIPPAQRLDVFLSPYYGWAIERLVAAIRPDASGGEAPEIPRYESSRGPGSTADVDYWTSKDVREVVNSHLNYVVADTKKWEQSASYTIDTHAMTLSFAKNAGLGFAIPYFHNGRAADYMPDFIVRLKGEAPRFLILETKGFDDLADVKAAAARRWTAAVNADGSFGAWDYAMARSLAQVRETLDALQQ
jgi:type III restriction enzyme